MEREKYPGRRNIAPTTPTGLRPPPPKPFDIAQGESFGFRGGREGVEIVAFLPDLHDLEPGEGGIYHNKSKLIEALFLTPIPNPDRLARRSFQPCLLRPKGMEGTDR
jgi:hypothetical protein